MYLRLLTSAEIKTNPEIAAFLIHPETGEQMVSGFGGGKKGWIANLGHGRSNIMLLNPPSV